MIGKSLIIVAAIVFAAEATVSHQRVISLVEKLDSGSEISVEDVRAAQSEYAEWEFGDFDQLERSSEELLAKVDLLQMLVFERLHKSASLLEASDADSRLSGLASVWKQLQPYYLGKSSLSQIPAQVNVDSIEDLLEEVNKADDGEQQKLDRTKLQRAAQEYRQLEKRLRELVATVEPNESESMQEIQSLMSIKNQAGVRVLADIFFPIADIDMEPNLLGSLKRIYQMQMQDKLH